MEILVPEQTKKLNDVPDCLKSIEGFPVVWKHFQEHRKNKDKAKMTPYAESLILAKLAQRPDQAIHALQAAIENGWKSFKWEYFDNGGNNRTKGHKTSGIPEHSPWDFEIPNRKN